MLGALASLVDFGENLRQKETLIAIDQSFFFFRTKFLVKDNFLRTAKYNLLKYYCII